MVRATKIYRYVMVVDGGMAPNPRGEFLSLATCKPAIRKSAKEGDWVVANRESPHNDQVVWAGRISETLPIADYSRRYPKREDALYRLGDTGLLERIPGRASWYHPEHDQQAKDMKGNVLLFDWQATWYFGSQPRSWPQALQHLIARGQGHRVNGVKPTDEKTLLAWLRVEHSPGAIGLPRDGWEGPRSSMCSSRRRPRCNAPSPGRSKRSSPKPKRARC